MAVNRRKFIKNTTAAATALLIPSIEHIAFAGRPRVSSKEGFELKILATNWGYAGTLDSYCAQVKKEGYDGIEIWWPNAEKDQKELFSLLKKHSLDVGFLCGNGESDYKKHSAAFKKMVTAAANSSVKPLYINCHSGKDYFSFDENNALIDYTTTLANEIGIKICHETHRSRMLFAAPVARQFLQKNSALRLTFDVSHWCTVSESLLDDQPETLKLAISRTDHIHARIGHPEGPQVNDPAAPEWQNTVKAHLAWWDEIVKIKKSNGEKLTILTEFGPPDYMPVLPFTRQPVADQWSINVAMMNILRKRYA